MKPDTDRTDPAEQTGAGQGKTRRDEEVSERNNDGLDLRDQHAVSMPMYRVRHQRRRSCASRVRWPACTAYACCGPPYRVHFIEDTKVTPNRTTKSAQSDNSSLLPLKCATF